MTKEEAIVCLKGIKDYGRDTFTEQSDWQNSLDMAIKALEQDVTDTNVGKIDSDCVSRQAVVEWLEHATDDSIEHAIDSNLEFLPPVTPIRKVGKWIYDRGIQNWKCSECGETPKTLGYVGTSLFMTEHFKFCNHCGAEMIEVQSYENIY